ncbi:MAG TPA: copper chaperone PCu(A)C [Pseudolabrys sp.]|nr:copper chaperone PCu(A)C [Pseudolabrys sp.]
MFRFICAAALAVTLAIPALAADYTAGSLKISAPWARATPKGAQVGGGYMTITNNGSTPDRLISGASGISSSFEVHEMSMDGGVMKMRMLKDGLEIKPGETVTLKPGGYHIMFMGLKDQLKQGDTFKATLQFEKAGKVEVEYKIEGIAATGADASGHGGMKH